VDDWGAYLGGLQATGPPPAVTGHLSGFIRITAQNFTDARTLLAGNPVFESGGTIEIRELPITD
jgi:hypothetical protein